MNLFEFLEEYFFIHFFSPEKLATISVQIGDTVIDGYSLLYLVFSVFAFLVGCWVVLYLPIKGIKFLAGVRRKK